MTPTATALRPLGVGELLDSAVRAAYRNAPAALLVAVPFAVVRAGVDGLIRYGAAGTASGGVAFSVLLAEVAVSCLLGTVLAGLLAPLFTSALLGERIGAGESLRRARPSVLRLVVVALVATVAETGGLLLLGVGGVWLWGIWAVAAPALVLERTGIRAAFSRSFGLVTTQFWRTWGTRALRWVVTAVLGYLVRAPFLALATVLLRETDVGGNGLYVVLTAVGDLLALSVVTPVSAAVDTFLYADLRMRREGMDIVLALPRPQAVTA